MKLSMTHFLVTVRNHGIATVDVLRDEGFHSKVIYAKATKAAAKGYTDYGVVADRPWLLPAGREFVRNAVESDPSTGR